MNLKNLDLNLLRVLDAVVTERHVSRAAERLHLSQPAMSNALGRLRTALDDPILVRAKGGMLPTPRAEALAGPVREALLAVEQALFATQSFTPAGLTQTFTLAMPDYYALLLLPPLRARLAREAPGVKLSLLGFDAPVVTELLASGEADLAATALEVLGENPDPRCRQLLFTDQFVCIAAKNHLNVQGSLTLEQFLESPHLLVSTRGGAFHGVVDEALAMIGHKRQVAVSVPHFLLAPTMVQQCPELIATIPGRLAHHFHDTYPLQMLRPPIELGSFEVHQIWHPRTDNDPAQRWLRKLVAEVAASLPQSFACTAKPGQLIGATPGACAPL